MSRWKKWKEERKKTSQPSPVSEGVEAPEDPPKAERLEAENLARHVADDVENVINAGGGVDRSGVDVPVAGDPLHKPDVSALAVDVGEASVPEIVEAEAAIKAGASLPLGEDAPELASAEPATLAGNEDGRLEADALAVATLPGEKLPELVSEGIGDKDLLSGSAVGLLSLEGSEPDAALGDDHAAVILAEGVTHIEGGDLEATETGPESDSKNAVVSESVSVLAADPQESGDLGIGESVGRSCGGGIVRHSTIVGKADSQINGEDLEQEREHCVSVEHSAPNADRKDNAPTAKHSKKSDSNSATSEMGGGASDRAPRKPREVEGAKSGDHLIVVKRTEQEFRDWVATEVGFLTAIARFDDEEVKLEPYQIQFLSTKNPYRSVEKSRQVGYSWLFAGEAIARSHLANTHNSIFVSYNLADAKEKIAYAAQMHEELPLEFQKKKVIDSKHEIGFRSNASGKRISRIISHPSRAPRGKKGDIYLDELAHYANDREVYKGSTALILRSKGQLTVCSSPLGRRGQFWEIARQEMRPYPVYWRQKVPWWLCSFFRRDSSEKGLLDASVHAPSMGTKERVYKYGSQGIIDQYESMPLEDFQQEFEVLYVDETMAFYPYDLILPCTNDELETAEDFSLIKPRSDSRIVCGFDVGRKKDLSELSIFEELASGKKVCRGLFSYPKTKFKVQENALRSLMDMLPVHKLYIDSNGIGMQLAENLADDYPQVEEFTFSGASKEMLATDFKISLQQHDVVLPRDRRLVSEIHSIRKRTTAAGRVVFETNDGSGEGHADRFWSVAMACQKERGAVIQPSSVSVRIIN